MGCQITVALIGQLPAPSGPARTSWWTVLIAARRPNRGGRSPALVLDRKQGKQRWRRCFLPFHATPAFLQDSTETPDTSHAGFFNLRKRKLPPFANLTSLVSTCLRPFHPGKSEPPDFRTSPLHIDDTSTLTRECHAACTSPGSSNVSRPKGVLHLLLTRLPVASPHCVASPDGTLIATLTTGSISFRSIETLETTHSVRLPSKLGPANAFLWSPSSRRVLVSFAESIHVYSALESGYRAVVRNPASPNFKPTFVQFGASDSEILMCSSFGLKFSVFDLTTSRAVEIGSPKFHQPTSAPRGFALRPGSGHLALLTRVSGKDIVSIHHPTTRGVQRSWHPETVDAQGLTWTPDGRRLIMWESAAQGHKVLFYTADGHLLNTWSGLSAFEPEEKHFDLGAGVKVCQVSPDGARIAVCDHTRNVCILDTKPATASMRLEHPAAIVPKDTVQVGGAGFELATSQANEEW